MSLGTLLHKERSAIIHEEQVLTEKDKTHCLIIFSYENYIPTINTKQNFLKKVNISSNLSGMKNWKNGHIFPNCLYFSCSSMYNKQWRSKKIKNKHLIWKMIINLIFQFWKFIKKRFLIKNWIKSCLLSFAIERIFAKPKS